jgi:hypothetical protein
VASSPFWRRKFCKGSLIPNEPMTASAEEGKLVFKQKATDAPKALSN